MQAADRRPLDTASPERDEELRVTDGWAPAGDDQAPICPACGVTALPASPRHVIDPSFVCDNPDCDAYGEVVPSGAGT